jgi:hypothetical protein
MAILGSVFILAVRYDMGVCSPYEAPGCVQMVWVDPTLNYSPTRFRALTKAHCPKGAIAFSMQGHLQFDGIRYNLLILFVSC